MPPQIEEVSTTTAGFVGPTALGPEDRPTLLTSLSEFERVYGDGGALTFAGSTEPVLNFMWHAARGFFEQGGTRLFVQRVSDANGRPGADEYASALRALEGVAEISTVAAPGCTQGYEGEQREGASAVLRALVDHAERMRYRFAVLDSGDGQSIEQVSALRAAVDSSHAALYWPWVRVRDPLTGADVHLPPSGFVAGIYARNDIERGVFKASANEVVTGALGVASAPTDTEGEVLAELGINWLRLVGGKVRVWGARTISSDPEWKYVSLRRYIAYLEHSIDSGTQWAVFEPNGEALWAEIRRTVTDFLLTEYHRGGLLGDRPEQAFFVRCDRTTMTQNDLDNGRLVFVIGVAPLRPAEFVVIQISLALAPTLAAPERTRYFPGKLLTADDLERDQAYLREKRYLHNRFAHGYGVVTGLEVTAAGEGKPKLVVGPGIAVDPRGREIVVPGPYCLSVEAFGEGWSTVSLVYAECETEAGTVREGFEVVLREGRPGDDAGVVLATVLISAGEAPLVDARTYRTILSSTSALEQRLRSLEERLAELEQQLGR